MKQQFKIGQIIKYLSYGEVKQGAITSIGVNGTIFIGSKFIHPESIVNIEENTNE